MWVEYTSAATPTILLSPSPIDGSSMKSLMGLCAMVVREREAPVVDGSCNGLDEMGCYERDHQIYISLFPHCLSSHLCYCENTRTNMRKAKGEKSTVAREGGKEKRDKEEGSISPERERERERRVPAVGERRPEDTSEISIAVDPVNLPSAVGGGEVGGLVAMESLLRKREKVEIGCSGGETQRQKR
ncbi:hypothetical protein HYC85_027706 [Camellia sinensis]|uniref:Uncharacterized protein n=1 Tax=Camellia sinensis TaxID=4442 RepID=A0A7J7FT49_CAMSI|nr:hypothetical protein HYC85_027706 [Camellia sinensis]